MHGVSRGTTEGAGESESFVPTIEWLPSQLYSLPEQLNRLSGEIQNLALREVFVKVDNAAPVRTRTATTEPAFAMPAFRRLYMPLFHRQAVAKSGCLFPVAEVDALIAKHLAELSPSDTPEPDFAAPEPVHIADDPEAYARDFIARNPDAVPRKPFGIIKGGKRPGDNLK